MKRLLCAIMLMLAIVFALSACAEYVPFKPTITVSDDGYLVVNGMKTECEVNEEDVITIEDGYLVVNGVKTEHRVYSEPVITIIDGYVAVNGVKTEHEAKNKNHSFGDWRLYNGDEEDCEKKLYYRTCTDCSTIEWREGKYADHDFKTVTTKPTCQAGGYDTKTCKSCGKVEVCNETPKAAHTYEELYSFNEDYHWRECTVCKSELSKGAHIIGEDGVCMVCDPSVQPTEGVVYDLSADGTYASVIAYAGTATKIKIAEEYKGVPVKEIYNEAFKNTSITSVIIPNSVTSIGNSAFCACDSLTSVVIGESVTSIGSSAFYDCRSLASVVIGDSVTSIGDSAFSNCGSLSSIYITDIASWCSISGLSNLMNKKGNLYLNNELLTNLIIPDGVTSIGNSAFSGCSSLTSVVIGDSVTSIGNLAFYNCDSLTSVIIGDSVTGIGDSAFSNCNSELYTEYEFGKYLKSGDNPYAVLIELTNKNLSTYEIHPNTKIIANGVFSGCSRLSNIVIPDGVVSIGGGAFSRCYSLVSVVIPDSVTSICDEAFAYGCSKITDVYYTGTEEEWADIVIGDNHYLTRATIHYNYVPEE